jgi:hypothetical protein
MKTLLALLAVLVVLSCPALASPPGSNVTLDPGISVADSSSNSTGDLPPSPPENDEIQPNPSLQQTSGSPENGSVEGNGTAQSSGAEPSVGSAESGGGLAGTAGKNEGAAEQTGKPFDLGAALSSLFKFLFGWFWKG